MDLYAMGNTMRKAVIDSITSEATGCPKENLIDYNPDTYWKPTGTGTVVWDIDLQEAKQVDAIILFVNNYLTDFSGGGIYLAVQSSPDDSSYTGQLNVIWDAPLTHPIYIEDISGSPTYRYWRISISSLASIIQLSGCFLSRKYSIAKTHQMPNRDVTRYFNDIKRSASGRTHSALFNSQASKILPRSFLLDNTDWTALLNAYNACYGSTFPLVVTEDNTNYFVRFDGQLNKNEISHQLYAPSIQLIEQPYIPDGETY